MKPNTETKNEMASAKRIRKATGAGIFLIQLKNDY